jgi:hypothetical protein
VHGRNTDDGEPATFVVAQAHAPAVQLRLEHAVLFPQEFDEIALFPFDPADQHGDDQRQRKHAWSLRQSGVGGVIRHYELQHSSIVRGSGAEINRDEFWRGSGRADDSTRGDEPNG